MSSWARWTTSALVLYGTSPVLMAQTPDSVKPYTLAPTVVSVTRADLPLSKTSLAIQTVDRQQISLARPTWGLDEALFSVPGVYAANRYNFSLDQRISIRGFGSRSAFAVRGIKVLLDGIPQTLPDGQGQLTNLELGTADRIEVLRGASSALFGNAAGGVISIWTRSVPPAGLSQEIRVIGGAFDRELNRTWSKWQSTTQARVGSEGSALLSVARLGYAGERDHSKADLRSVTGRFHTSLRPGWSLTLSADFGDQPKADNPGALTRAELLANRDSAPAINLSTRAGKDVLQAQGGMTLRGRFGRGSETAFTLFGLTRDLENPTTFAYIQIDRRAYGARASLIQPFAIAGRPQRLTVGIDFQRQRDDRRNFGNSGGAPDTARALDQLEHVTEIGPFIQSALEVTPSVTVTAGMRYDRVSFDVTDRLVSGTNPDDSGERLMDAVSGSLGVAVSPSDRVTVYGNVGSSFETPTTTELANRPTGAGGFNDSLGPQRAWSYEIGMRGAVNGRLRWSLALYQADVRDELISYEVPGVPQRRFFRNAGSARHRGIELGADARLFNGVSMTGAWTYSDFRYRNYSFVTPSGPAAVLDGRELPGVPKHSLRLGARARPALARGGWMEIETMHTSSYLVDDTLTTRTAPWWHTNVRLGWEGTAGTVRISPFVGFNNIFNRHYVGSVVINAARGRYYEPAPGRNAYFGLSLGADR